jgi:hypothetical protein
MQITRSHLVSLSLGSVGGFVAGAFVGGQYLYGAIGIIMGFWSLVIGLIIAPPLIAERGKRNLLAALEDPEIVQPVLQSLAAATASRFDYEMLAPATESKPVLAAVNRLGKSMMASIEQSYQATKMHVEADLKKSGLGAVLEGDELEVRMNAVEAAAKEAGIDSKLIGRGRFLLSLRRIFEGAGSPGGQPALPSRKKGLTQQGRDGYL